MRNMDNTDDPQKAWRMLFNQWCGEDRTLKEIQLDLLGHKIKLSEGQISALRNPVYKRLVSMPVAKRLQPVTGIPWVVAFP